MGTAKPLTTTRLPHRGAQGDTVAFGHSFVTSRLAGFEKDMKICLTGIKAPGKAGVTHAYFPALMACCGMLEYLAALFLGQVGRTLNNVQISAYATAYMRQPDYAPETVRILFDALRNPIAHRSIATGVWADHHDEFRGRRLTWKVLADSARPAIRLVEEVGEVHRDSPWPCRYTHRVHVHLGSLWRDIAESVPAYLDALAADGGLQKNFNTCMRRLYPE
jgi:hypothetical protein